MRAQALIFAIFLLFIGAVISVGLMNLWEPTMLASSLQEKNLIAFYLAQAGVERAKIEILKNVSLSGDSIDFSGLDESGDNYNFYYNFSVSVSGTRRDIIGRGKVYIRNQDGTDGKLIAHREVAVTVDGIVDNVNNATGLPPADGIDDDLSGSIVSGSWREI